MYFEESPLNNQYYNLRVNSRKYFNYSEREQEESEPSAKTFSSNLATLLQDGSLQILTTHFKSQPLYGPD